MAFVPAGFDGPRRADRARLPPRSRSAPSTTSPTTAAWSTSIEHIRATPGFQERGWPPAEGMTLEENLGDLERHARDFAARTGLHLQRAGARHGRRARLRLHLPGADDEHERGSPRGCARPSPSSTASCTRSSAAGWRTRGRSPRSSTRIAVRREGADQNRTGVNGFAGRCVATPPRRRRVLQASFAAGGVI